MHLPSPLAALASLSLKSSDSHCAGLCFHHCWLTAFLVWEATLQYMQQVPVCSTLTLWCCHRPPADHAAAPICSTPESWTYHLAAAHCPQAHRFPAWETTLQYVQQHRAANELHSWTAGLTEWADWTDDEFRAAFLGQVTLFSIRSQLDETMLPLPSGFAV